MSTNIAQLFASIPGLKQDFKMDWKEDAKADWKNDWDAITGPVSEPLTAPINTVAALITGTPEVGQVLTLDKGTWTGNPVPTFTYTWSVDGMEVAGETASTYTIRPEDEGFDVAGTVTASNSQGDIAVVVTVGPVVVA